MAEINDRDGLHALLPGALARPTGRRGFLRIGGAVAATAVLGLGACDDIFGGDDADDADVELDFSTDFGVLNYAYALEQLEAAYYTQVVASSSFSTTFSAEEQRVLRDLRDHEVAHRDFFAAAIPTLGGTLIPQLTPDFTGLSFTSRQDVLVNAANLEDLGVAAYNGAGKYLTNPALLTIAGKIVSVEARHAAAVRDLVQPKSNVFAPSAFDLGAEPSQVLAIAGGLIEERIRVRNAA
jgi:hypothetical protein